VKRYLNTLFVTKQGAYLSKEGETVVVSLEHKKLLQIPSIAISGIVCFGNIMISPFLMGYCAENNISLSFLSEYGRFLASVQGRISGNVLLRRKQYRVADDENESLEISRNFISAKIYNCRTVIKRAVRDHPDKVNIEDLNKVSDYLVFSIRKVQSAGSLDELRGIEGDTAASYFSVFDNLVLTNNKDFRFKERNRRPPKDNINCLLSFIYTLLTYDVRSALDSVGLDSCVGFLHKDRPGRASLALDMVEEWRAAVGDRVVLSLINREQLTDKNFKKSDTGAVLMTDEGRRTVIETYQKKKQEEINHPFLNETVEIGLLFYIQALLLARFLRGDIDAYPAFLWK